MDFSNRLEFFLSYLGSFLALPTLTRLHKLIQTNLSLYLGNLPGIIIKYWQGIIYSSPSKSIYYKFWSSTSSRSWTWHMRYDEPKVNYKICWFSTDKTIFINDDSRLLICSSNSREASQTEGVHWVSQWQKEWKFMRELPRSENQMIWQTTQF